MLTEVLVSFLSTSRLLLLTPPLCAQALIVLLAKAVHDPPALIRVALEIVTIRRRRPMGCAGGPSLPIHPAPNYQAVGADRCQRARDQPTRACPNGALAFRALSLGLPGSEHQTGAPSMVRDAGPRQPPPVPTRSAGRGRCALREAARHPHPPSSGRPPQPGRLRCHAASRRQPRW